MGQSQHLKLIPVSDRKSFEVMEGMGITLKKERESRGWTLEEAARKSGVRKSTIKRMEQGDSFVQMGKFSELCLTYGLHPGKF